MSYNHIWHLGRGGSTDDGDVMTVWWGIILQHVPINIKNGLGSAMHFDTAGPPFPLPLSLNQS